jgi:hypothetical protein
MIISTRPSVSVQWPKFHTLKTACIVTAAPDDVVQDELE